MFKVTRVNFDGTTQDPKIEGEEFHALIFEIGFLLKKQNRRQEFAEFGESYNRFAKRYSVSNPPDVTEFPVSPTSMYVITRIK
jgi:hypothetical protein